MIAPCGGGGLLSGTAIAATSSRAGIEVFGAEPANAGDAAASFASGRVEPLPPTTTIADGLRTTLSPRTLGAIRAHVDGVRNLQRRRDRARDAHDVGADEDRRRALRRGAARMPAGAIARPGRPRVGVIVSGGNVDLDRLPWQT